MAFTSTLNSRQPALIERLVEDHERIAAALDQLAGAADRLPHQRLDNGRAVVSAALIALARIGELLGYLADYADRVHHPLEDQLVDRALHRGLTPTERHLVFKNLGTHQEILTLTARLQDDTRLAVSGGGIDDTGFVNGIARFVALQRSHMRFEELHLFPLLVARLTNEDWNSLTSFLDLAQKEPNNEQILDR